MAKEEKKEKDSESRAYVIVGPEGKGSSYESLIKELEQRGWLPKKSTT